MPSRLERLIRIEQQINQLRYPGVETLCEMFAVKPRTLFEDIRLLKQHMGLAIQFDRNRGGYFNADPNKRLPAFDLTCDELSAVFLAAELLVVCKKGSKQVVESALSKIINRLPGYLANNYEDMGNDARRAAQGLSSIVS